MTKHEMVTFRLHRGGVILAVILALVFAILIFAAGYLTATARRRAVVPAAPAKSAAKPAAAPQTPATASSAPAAQALTIRAGAFATEEEAKALAGKLTAGKIESRIVPFETAEGTTLYLVLAGSYTTRPEALAAMSQIEQKEGVTGAVIPLPPP